MGTETVPQLDLPELERRLRAADPAALLVQPRLLRRVIKTHHRLPGIGLQVPHRKSYVIRRQALVELISLAELGLAPGQELPETLLLLARPDPDRLSSRPPGQVLRKFWRLLYHAAVHRALEGDGTTPGLSEAALCERLRELGPTRVEEVRGVLQKEYFLFPEADERAVYGEFVAVYLELRYFAPGLLGYYFPSLDDYEVIDTLIGRDLDVEGLLERCRPEGASYPDPLDLLEAPTVTDDLEGPEPPAPPVRAAAPSPEARTKLLRSADEAATPGNHVRAAILRHQAGEDAGTDLDRLVERLRAALRLNDHEAAEWRRAIQPLLEPASRGIWPAARRLLYDLQKACIDSEKEVYALDLVEWIVSLGKKPIKRKLPFQGLVLQVRDLRGALHRLRSVHVTDPERVRLANLLVEALHHAEERLRTAIRPTLECELDSVGMRPANLPERIARRKIVEELLDRIVAQRFLTMGDLRDAVSRNNLKYPDLSGPREFFQGDQLILANRRLAIALDGIYHRGEIYLRWLQRFSSTAFGTPVGRFLTLYFALPFGGAYVILEGLQYLLGHLSGHRLHILPHPEPDPSLPEGQHPPLSPEQRLQLAGTVGVVGVLLLLLLHVPAFRSRVLLGLQLTWRGLSWLFQDLPRIVYNLPPVRRALESRWFAIFKDYLFQPLVCAGLAALLAVELGDDSLLVLLAAAGTFAASFVVFNSPLVRHVEELCLDAVARWWWQLQTDLLPGLLRLVMALFRWFVDRVNRGLYTVDEWLRFRPGDRSAALVIKPVLGLVWFLVTYVVRFTINLIVEPQINPIKHFPVVTVSHKLIYALVWFPLTKWLEARFSITFKEAGVIATIFCLGPPGICGFLAWELKENWKLYRANRPKKLRPVAIGHHGETMVRFFRPGFHSGTLPKLYARLRKAARQRNWPAFGRNREALHHVEESIRHLIERELATLLEESHIWGSEQLCIREVRLGTREVEITLGCPELGTKPLVLVFEEQAGWLLAGIKSPGWAAELNRERRTVLKNALAGLYKLAGVHLVHEQVAEQLRAPVPLYGVTRRGLEIGLWSPPRQPVVYDLEEQPQLHPRYPDGAPAAGYPVLEPRSVLFAERAIFWDDWVAFWEKDQKGERCGIAEMAEVRVLPTRLASHKGNHETTKPRNHETGEA